MEGSDRQDKSEEGLPNATQRAIQGQWKAKHAFELIGDMVLIASVQKTMYKALSSTPWTVPVLLAESLRPSSVLADRETVQQLERPGTGEARFREVVSDEVRGHFELYKRLRAYFWTLSLLAVEMGDWFTFQDALYASERILYFIHQTHGERRPPVSHFIQAWASTITRMADIVKTTSCSLAQAITRSAEWEHFWTFYSQPHSGGVPTRPPSVLPDPDTNMKKALENPPQYRKMQAERDKAMAEVKKRQRGALDLRPNPEMRKEDDWKEKDEWKKKDKTFRKGGKSSRQ